LTAAEEDREEKNKDKEPDRIIEEILVKGEVPGDLPAASVTVIPGKQLEAIRPVSLAEAIRHAPAVNVRLGAKNEYTLTLRGLDSRRIILLVDGIPVYEPYYGSFDLKTVSAGGIDFIQISKGPSSVLYGPNSLGGVVNVVTRRPGEKPELSFDLSLGDLSTRSLGMNGGVRAGRFGIFGSLLYQDSDGFQHPDGDGNSVRRDNSDYQRLNVNAKAFFRPSRHSEWMVNAGIYRSEYGMPFEINASRPRYWRFKNWDRATVNAGGYSPLGKSSLLRVRAYYVQYDNTLDWFNDRDMTDLDSSSTFDNSVLGLFAMTDHLLGSGHTLKLSASAKYDTVRTQDDVGEPWEESNQGTFSLAAEDHIHLSGGWKLIAGASLDFLDKFVGEGTMRLNPLIGVTFAPTDRLSLYVSLAQKSKFPSMRSLYSSTSGNPDLLSESGRMAELGFTFNKGWMVTGALFFTTFRDMIDSIRLPDGTRQYINVEEAHIHGFEFQAQKSLEWLDVTLNYTFLHHRNRTEARPLDAMPAHSLNFHLQAHPFRRLNLSLSGLFASESSWYDSSAEDTLDIPSYFVLDTVIAYRVGPTELFIKMGNLFDTAYYTEPGYPLRGRYVEAGIRLEIFK
jgi:iron complex outermembrane receptor protein